MVVAAVVLVMVILIAVVVFDASATVVQAIMLFVVVIGRSTQVAHLLARSLVGCSLSENFDVDVVEIQVQIVLLNFELAIFKLCHQAMRALRLTETARDFFRVHPERQLNWQLQILVINTTL